MTEQRDQGTPGAGAVAELAADLGIGVRKRYYQPENKDAYTMRLLLSDDAGAQEGIA